jgi:hypothetical protein
MSRRAMVEAIKGLVQKRMIRRESKSGHARTYVLTDKSTWVLEGATNAPNAQVRGEGWAPYAQGVGTICPGVGTICPQRIQIRIKVKRLLVVRVQRTLTTTISLAPTGASLNYPYESKRADFVRYNAWKKLDAGLTDDALFEKAVSNYLASPQGQYTFADLVHRFAVFRNSALDRFGKPVESRTPPPPVPSPPPPWV